MKIVSIIARYLLGLEFLVFGANKLHMFLPMGPLPTGAALQFFNVMMSTHYLYAIAILEVVGGLLLLIGRYVPLALTLLGPVVVNILLFHILMAPSGLPVAGLTAVLWLLVFYRERSAFAGIFQAKVQS
jgi:uncharacterized membrane protein YphA (DoxX/SURF4 family)